MVSHLSKIAVVAGATLVALAAMVNPSAAQTATGTGTANSSSNSAAVAVNGGQSIVFNTPGQQSVSSRIRQSGSLKTTPNAIAPGLGSAAIETCYGPGVSAGLAVTGFGASFGAGQWDTSCNRRLNARTIYAFGFKQQALAIMLNDPEVAQAFGYGQGGPAAQPAAYGYRRAPGAVAVQAGGGECGRWSGGATGVGSCLWYR